MKGRLFGIMKIKLVLVMKSQQGESHSRDFPPSKDEKCHIVIVFKYPIRPEGRCNEQQDVNIEVLERAELVSVAVHVPS